MKALKALMAITLVMSVAMVMGCASMDAVAKKSTLIESVPAPVLDSATTADVKTTTAITKTPALPKEGEYGAASHRTEFKVIGTSTEKTIFTISLDSEQVGPDWQIYASWAWTDGERWFLVDQDDYKISTEETSSGNLKAIMKFPEKGIGWYWVRIWGQNEKSKNWLWINQASEYCRNDTQGNPGYEVLAHPATGKYQPVSAKYQIRK